MPGFFVNLLEDDMIKPICETHVIDSKQSPQKGMNGFVNDFLMDDVYFILLVGGVKHELYFPSYMGCHPNPIDELHHFSRLLLHHQPDSHIYIYNML